MNTITIKRWRSCAIVKYLQRTTQHRQGVFPIYRFLTSLLLKTFDLSNPHPSSRFNNEDILSTLTYAAVFNLSPESCVTQFKIRALAPHHEAIDTPQALSHMIRSHTVPGLPSADTLNARLAGLSMQLVDTQLHSALKQIFLAATVPGIFTGKTTKDMIAIDFHDKPFYGDKNTKLVVRGQRTAGTSTFFRYATTNIVEQGKRFTMAALPVGPLDSKVGVLEKLLGRVNECELKSRLILLDRQFFTIEVIQFFNEAGKQYLMPAKKNAAVKRHILAYARGKGPQVVWYRMGNKRRWVEGNLVIYKRDLKSDGNKRSAPEEKSDEELINEHIAFMTNLEMRGLKERVTRVLKKLPGWYKKRFGIETSYRIKNEFLVRTSSTSVVVRWFYFALSVILYNTWVLCNVWCAVLNSEGINEVRVKELMVVLQLAIERYFVGKGPPVVEDINARR